MIQRRETIEDILDRISQLYEEGKSDRARKEVRRARRLHPGDLVLLEWEATFASDEGRHAEALAHLESVLAIEPDRPFALREKASVFLALGRHEEALGLLTALSKGEERGEASLHHDRAICLDRLGRMKEADREFTAAARSDPDGFPLPPRLAREAFEDVVGRAVDSIPSRFQEYLRNVLIEVLDYPTHPPLDAEVSPDLLGIYVGVPRTERGETHRDHLDRIYIFKRNLEIEFPDPGELREEIRKTVIHEIAHHFGLGEEEMGDYA